MIFCNQFIDKLKLTYSQLPRGDTDSKQKKSRRIIRERKQKNNVVAPIASIKRRLKPGRTTIRGTRVQALLDSGVVPYLLFSKLVRNLANEVKVSAKEIAVSIEYVTDTIGAVFDMKTSFEDVQVPLNFLVFTNRRFAFIVISRAVL